MVAVSPSAVLFDLFGTLVPAGTRAERDAVSYRVATELDVEPEDLASLVRDTFDDRTTGRLGDLADTLAELAARLHARPSVAAIERAAHHRLQLTRSLLRQSWGLPVLDRLRAQGVPIGIVSDCSAETPAVWSECPLAARVDTTAFSCLLGVRKPDPAIYLAATDELDVDPARCVFVGDGGSHELSGARALGMRAIWFDRAVADQIERPDAESGWVGERVTRLAEIFDLAPGPLSGRVAPAPSRRSIQDP